MDDIELAQKMQEIARRKAETAREEEEAKHFARQKLAQLDKHIQIKRDELAELEAERNLLAGFAGVRSLDDAPRMPHGARKEFCFEAIRSANRPLTVAEVKAYIEQNYPEVKLISVPATLSRQREYGNLYRDRSGRYSLWPV